MASMAPGRESKWALSAENALEVSDLTVRIRDSTILDRLSFTVRKGEILAIIGPNGSGKTTLFRALMGMIPFSGSVKWSKGLRMGYVPQSLVVTDIPVTVEEFLRFKCKSDLTECLNIVGLGNDILNAELGKLSGGQLQRVLLAWSIVDYPDVLLFDEPTSGVDIGAEEPIYEKVKELNEKLGITVLLISHNHHIVMHYTHYLLAINRKMIFFGETAAVPHEKLALLMVGEPLKSDNAMLPRRAEGGGEHV